MTPWLINDQLNHNDRHKKILFTRHCRGWHHTSSYHHHLSILDFSDKFGLLAIPLLHLHQFVSLHGEGWLQAQAPASLEPSQVNLQLEHMSHWRYYSAYFDMSVIRRGLIKLLSQLGGELSVPEGALGFHHHFVSILTDDYCWFGGNAHLSRGKTNTCPKK